MGVVYKHTEEQKKEAAKTRGASEVVLTKSKYRETYGRLRTPFVVGTSTAVRLLDNDNNPVTIRADGIAKAFGTGLKEDAYVYVLSCDKGDNVFYCDVVIPGADAKLFENIDPLSDRSKIIKVFYNLSDGKQNNIRAQLGLYLQEDAEIDLLDDIEDFRLKYYLCHDTYPGVLQEHIELWLSQYAKAAKPSILRERLYSVLNILPSIHAAHSVSVEEAEDALTRHVCGYPALKRELAEVIAAESRLNCAPTAWLFVGPPGTVKSTLAYAMAEADGKPFTSLNLAGISTGLELISCSPIYDRTTPGKLMEAILHARTSTCVLLLKNLDACKMSYYKDGDPYDALFSMLSKRSIPDQYLACEYPVPNIRIIATTSSLKNIPKKVLDCFQRVYFSPYTGDELVQIADWAIPQMMENYPFKHFVGFEKRALHRISDEYCLDDGFSQMKQNIERILRKLLLDPSTACNSRIVSESDVDHYLSGTVDRNSDRYQFKHNLNRYPDDIQDAIRECFYIIEDESREEKLRDVERRRLRYLLSVKKPIGQLSFSRKAFEKALQQSHVGMAEVKEKLIGMFTMAANSKESFSRLRILLHGPMGTGKSSLAEALSKALGLAYVRIPLNGITRASDLKGVPRTIWNGDAGLIFQKISKVSSPDGRYLIHLDEVDKLGMDQGCSAATALVDLLDDYCFFDAFADVQFDLSSCVFVLTANRLDHVYPVLLDRCELVALNGYNHLEKAAILDHLIGKLRKEYPSIQVRVQNAARRLLVNSYSPGPGVRELRRNLYAVVRKKLSAGGNSRILTISERDVTEALPYPFPRGNLPLRNAAGLIRGLAVGNDGVGVLSAIETVVLPDDQITEITGLAKQTVQETVTVALTWLKIHYPHQMEGKGFHIHFSEAAVEKEGSSAGVAVLLSILSAVTGVVIPPDVCLTGEIDLFGNVFPVGGIEAKLECASAGNCTRAFIPLENEKALVMKRGLPSGLELEIVGVDHVSKVIAALFPNLGKTASSLLTVSR